jgi:hypothetical protein
MDICSDPHVVAELEHWWIHTSGDDSGNDRLDCVAYEQFYMRLVHTLNHHRRVTPEDKSSLSRISNSRNSPTKADFLAAVLELAIQVPNPSADSAMQYLIDLRGSLFGDAFEAVQKWWDADGPAREMMFVVTGSVPLHAAEQKGAVYDRLVARSMTRAQYRSLVEGGAAGAALARAAEIGFAAAAAAAVAATTSALATNTKEFQDLKARLTLQRQRRLEARRRRQQETLRITDKDSLQLVCLSNFEGSDTFSAAPHRESQSRSTNRSVNRSVNRSANLSSPPPSSPGTNQPHSPYQPSSPYRPNCTLIGESLKDLPFVQGLLPMSLWSPSSYGSTAAGSSFASPVHNHSKQQQLPLSVGEGGIPAGLAGPVEGGHLPVEGGHLPVEGGHLPVQLPVQPNGHLTVHLNGNLAAEPNGHLPVQPISTYTPVPSTLHPSKQLQTYNLSMANPAPQVLRLESATASTGVAQAAVAQAAVAQVDQVEATRPVTGYGASTYQSGASVFVGNDVIVVTTNSKSDNHFTHTGKFRMSWADGQGGQGGGGVARGVTSEFYSRRRGDSGGGGGGTGGRYTPTTPQFYHAAYGQQQMGTKRAGGMGKRRASSRNKRDAKQQPMEAASMASARNCGRNQSPPPLTHLRHGGGRSTGGVAAPLYFALKSPVASLPPPSRPSTQRLTAPHGNSTQVQSTEGAMPLDGALDGTARQSDLKLHRVCRPTKVLGAGVCAHSPARPATTPCSSAGVYRTSSPRIMRQQGRGSSR